MESLGNIRIVLIGTTHPGNIGAVARSMKCMGLADLALVAPKIFPHSEATARASGADDLLERARVSDALPPALEGCRLVIGTSARRRSIQWPELTPRQAAERLHREAQAGPVALLFGRERSGLSNDELDRCHYLTRVDTDESFSSLNIAAAVQLFAYELRLAALAGAVAEPAPSANALADAVAVENFHGHLARMLLTIGFTEKRQSEKLMRRLRRLFNRVRLEADEVNLLRGIFKAAEDRRGGAAGDREI